MFAYYTNACRDFNDFNIIQYGYRQCEPLFAPKKTVRSTYLIHYVYKGEGYLEADGVQFPIKENQAFVIFPGQTTTYVASQDKPMFYKWVEFYGDKCEEVLNRAHLSAENPVLNDEPPYYIGEKLANLVDGGVGEPFEIMAKFYDFLNYMCKGRSKCEKQGYRYVDMAVNYIHYCSSAKLTVNQVANYVNVSRSFLSRIFTEKMGMSPKRYIIEKSMESALTMLKNERLSIAEISDLLGYDDVVEFTKAFTRHEGVSPSKYRNNMKNRQ